MSRIIKSEIWTFIQDNTPVFNIVFQTLEVIYLVSLVIGVYRKDGRLTLPALVLYPIYICFNSISYILSEYDFENEYEHDYENVGSFTIILIASNILSIVIRVLTWITVFLYRKQLKEQNLTAWLIAELTRQISKFKHKNCIFLASGGSVCLSVCRIIELKRT